ncbi:MAG: hypothetical protein EXR77_13500 [Myxococcales bacterium]|nr:hypothetical protein [Myxococcales bacterium]
MNWLAKPPDVAAWSDADLVKAHAAAQKQVRRLRTWLPLVVLAVIACYVMAIRATFQAIDGDAMAGAIEKRVAGLNPKIQKAMQDVGNEAGPVVSKALETESARAIDLFGGRIDSEVARLRTELPDKMKGQLDKRMRDLRRAQLARLQLELPQAVTNTAKAEQLLDAISAGTHEWAQRQLTTTFQKHLLELERLKRTLQKLATVDLAAIAKANGDGKALPAGATPGDVVGVKAESGRISPEQMLGTWLEIFEEAINGPEGETTLDDGKPAGNGARKEAQP